MSEKIIRNAGPRTRRTTQAMRSAPTGAVYVWVHDSLGYPKALAHAIGRDDLIVVGPGWLKDRKYMGLELGGLCMDHDARLTEELWERYMEAKTRVRPCLPG